MSKHLTQEERIKIADALKPMICSYTQPKSLIQGCLDGIKELANDPAGVSTAGMFTAGHVINAALTQSSMPGALLQSLGEEAITTCTYGMINTALDNCNTTYNSSILNPRNDPDSTTSSSLSSNLVPSYESSNLFRSDNTLDLFNTTTSSNSLSILGQDSSSNLFESHHNDLFGHDKLP